MIEGGEVIAPLSERILGRTALENIVDPLSGEVIVEKGSLIEEDKIEVIDRAGIDMVKIRSALMCESKGGVCVPATDATWPAARR